MRNSIALIAVCVGSTAAFAQVSYTTGTYFQDFDALPTATANGAVGAGWINDGTLPGWYSNQSTLFRVSAGTESNGAIYSYGDITNPASTERALGSVSGGSGAAGTGTAFNGVAYGAAFSNDNLYQLTDFTVDYTGEQWRNGAPNPNAAHTLSFSWQILPAGSSDAAIAAALTVATGWTAHAPLNFTGPIATGSASSLNGNLPANRITGITSTISNLAWNPGDLLVIRWSDPNDPSNDHGLAIDECHFSATPTPGAAALLGVGILASGRRRRV